MVKKSVAVPFSKSEYDSLSAISEQFLLKLSTLVKSYLKVALEQLNSGKNLELKLEEKKEELIYIRIYIAPKESEMLKPIAEKLDIPMTHVCRAMVNEVLKQRGVDG